MRDHHIYKAEREPVVEVGKEEEEEMEILPY